MVRAAIISLLGICAPSIAKACSIALALTVDVSGSINEQEYHLQMNGLSAALRNTTISDALVSSNVALMLVQWSGANRQAISVDWQRMLSFDDVERFATAVKNAPRAWGQFSTGIGGALEFTAAQFDRVQDCERYVIDVSGDGYSNEGPDPKAVSTTLAQQGFQINGIAIEGGDFEITEYYRHNVIAGEGAFIMTAQSYNDYPKTILQKLFNELTMLVSLNDYSKSAP